LSGVRLQSPSQAEVTREAKPSETSAGVTNLTDCITAAGTDSSALQACAAKFKP
jgi:hypothetical protein